MSSCAYLSKKLRLYSFPFMISYTLRIDRTLNRFTRLVPYTFTRSLVGAELGSTYSLIVNNPIKNAELKDRLILLRSSSEGLVDYYYYP